MENNPPIILAFESGGDETSVSILEGQKEIFGSTFFLPQMQSVMLAPMVEKAIRISGLGWKKINAVAVGKGPGSYTGLRIATSLAKGICFARNLPLMGISSMRNKAFQVFENHPEAEMALVSIDARRNEAYVSILERGGQEVLPSTALILSEVDLPALIGNKKVVLAGSGSSKIIAYFQKENDWILDDRISAHAYYAGLLAVRQFPNPVFEDLENFEPDYLKPVYIKSNS